LLLQNGESSHVLRIFDDEAQAMQSARSSSRMLEEAFETGVAILHKYADQRDRLKVKVCTEGGQQITEGVPSQFFWLLMV
jgi:hypothetical protein